VEPVYVIIEDALKETNSKKGKTIENNTTVQMPAKMFPHLKLLCLLFMGPTLGFDAKQRNSFLIKFDVFLQ
jgi:hypothetical protein